MFRARRDRQPGASAGGEPTRSLKRCQDRAPRPPTTDPSVPIRDLPTTAVSHGGLVTLNPDTWADKVESLERISLTLAGTEGGGGGLMQPPPLRFFWNIFFVNLSIVTNFSIAFRPSFLRPPENFKTLTPLKFDL